MRTPFFCFAVKSLNSRLYWILHFVQDDVFKIARGSR